MAALKMLKLRPESKAEGVSSDRAQLDSAPVVIV
jgi:hypothetical protein